ncbi:hypothetical protein G6F35_010541 [Rhizopus arrhizus]|nr:hypothetical protein G6F35_010541 [Rhizopus arrhizus]
MECAHDTPPPRARHVPAQAVGGSVRGGTAAAAVQRQRQVQQPAHDHRNHNLLPQPTRRPSAPQHVQPEKHERQPRPAPEQAGGGLPARFAAQVPGLQQHADAGTQERGVGRQPMDERCQQWRCIGQPAVTDGDGGQPQCGHGEQQRRGPAATRADAAAIQRDAEHRDGQRQQAIRRAQCQPPRPMQVEAERGPHPVQVGARELGPQCSRHEQQQRHHRQHCRRTRAVKHAQRATTAATLVGTGFFRRQRAGIGIRDGHGRKRCWGKQRPVYRAGSAAQLPAQVVAGRGIQALVEEIAEEDAWRAQQALQEAPAPGTVQEARYHARVLLGHAAVVGGEHRFRRGQDRHVAVQEQRGLGIDIVRAELAMAGGQQDQLLDPGAIDGSQFRCLRDCLQRQLRRAAAR